jgi:hypothetical protein
MVGVEIVGDSLITLNDERTIEKTRKQTKATK